MPNFYIKRTIILISICSFFSAISQDQKFDSRQLIINSENIGSNAFLKGNYLELGIGPNGSFVSTVAPPFGYHTRAEGSSLLGLVSDPEKNGWTTGSKNYFGDFFARGAYWEGFKVKFNSELFTNKYNTTEIPGSNLTSADGVNSKIGNWQGGVYGKFSIKQKVVLGNDDTHLTLRITLINQSSSTANFYYSRFVDPDNEQNFSGTYGTKNTIIAQGNESGKSLIRADGRNFGSYFGISSSDERSRVAISNPWGSSPDSYYNGGISVQTSGYQDSDAEIGIAFKFNAVNPTDSVVFEYTYMTRIQDEDLTLCALPIIFNTSKVLENSFDINWNNINSSNYSIRYKNIGSSDWVYTSLIPSSAIGKLTYTVSSLLPNTNYEYQIKKFCSNGYESAYSNSNFVTTNCIGIQNSTISIDTTFENKTIIHFDEKNSSGHTNIRYRKIGSSNWNFVSNIIANTFELSNLIPNTQYEVQNQSSCNIGTSAFSSSSYFKTKKCPRKINLGPTSIDGGIYEVLDSLISKSKIIDATTFYSEKSITLEPGFNSSSNQVFNARIQNCYGTLQNGLIAFFDFNSSYLDKSGNGVPLSYQNTNFTNGIDFGLNHSLNFNGYNSWVSSTNQFDILPKTVNLWFKNAQNYSFGDYGAIFQTDNPFLIYGNTGIAIVNFNGQNELYLTYSAVSTSKPVLSNEWYNVCITIDQFQTIRYYLNGVKIDTKTFSSYIKSSSGLQQTILGSSRYLNNSFFYGSIDDVRIYNRVLTDQEVLEIYEKR